MACSFCFRSKNGWYIKKSQFVAIVLRMIGISFQISSERLMHRPLWFWIGSHVASQRYRYVTFFLSYFLPRCINLLKPHCARKPGRATNSEHGLPVYYYFLNGILMNCFIPKFFSRLDCNDNNMYFIVLHFFPSLLASGQSGPRETRAGTKGGNRNWRPILVPAVKIPGLESLKKTCIYKNKCQ